MLTIVWNAHHCLVQTNFFYNDTKWTFIPPDINAVNKQGATPLLRKRYWPVSDKTVTHVGLG